MSTRIILTGTGGQGVVFAHRVLAQCAVANGEDVTGAETHGMSQRGGSVVSHLKIGETCAPLIRRSTADLLLAFDKAEAYQLLPYVRRGGTVIVNSKDADSPGENLRSQMETMRISIHLVDADTIARGLGCASSANMVLLGFACACDVFPFSSEALHRAILQVASGRSIESDLAAFDEGLKAGSQRRSLVLRDSLATQEDKEAGDYCQSVNQKRKE